MQILTMVSFDMFDPRIQLLGASNNKGRHDKRIRSHAKRRHSLLQHVVVVRLVTSVELRH